MSKYFKLFGFIILYLFIIFGFTEVFYYVLGWIASSSKPFSEWLYAYPLNLTVVALTFSTFVYFIIYKMRKRSLYKACNFAKVKLDVVCYAVIIGILMGVFTFSVAGLSFIKVNLPGLEKYMALTNDYGNIIGAVFIVFYASLLEEIIFRGMIFNELREKVPVVLALLLNGVVYSIMLMDLATGIFGFFAALLCAMFYLWGRSILASYTLQIVSGCAVLVFRRIGFNRWLNGLPETVLAAIAVGSVILIVMTVYFLKKSYSRGGVEFGSKYFFRA